MLDADGLRAQAEDAQIRAEMARSRLLLALSSRDALVSRRQDMMENQRGDATGSDQGLSPATSSAGAST